MEPQHQKSSLMTLSELRKEGIPPNILSDVEALAKIRASKATRVEGVSLKEYVEVRETGVIGQVVAIHDDRVVLDLGESQGTFEYGSFFSPFTFATVVAELVQEVVRVNEGAQRVAEAFRHEAAAMVAPWRPIELKKESDVKQLGGGDSPATSPSNPTS